MKGVLMGGSGVLALIHRRDVEFSIGPFCGPYSQQEAPLIRSHPQTVEPDI